MEWFLFIVVVVVAGAYLFERVSHEKPVSRTVVSRGVLTHYHYSGEVRIVVPEGVREIGEAAFNNCTALVKVELPSTLRRIDEHAFRCCYKLRDIELPKGLTHIGDKAFLILFPHQLVDISCLTAAAATQHPSTASRSPSPFRGGFCQRSDRGLV